MGVAHIRVPRHVQMQARQDILDRMPANLGAPERAAYECLPYELYMDTSGTAFAQYLSRFRRYKAQKPRVSLLPVIGAARAREEP